jgi:hypothetical protein
MRLSVKRDNQYIKLHILYMVASASFLTLSSPKERPSGLGIRSYPHTRDDQYKLHILYRWCASF